jgi:hypothetical protein
MTIEVAVEFFQQTAVDKTDQLYCSPVETLPCSTHVLLHNCKQKSSSEAVTAA